MSFLDLVRKRKSLRKYCEKKIPRDIIEKAVEAARLAPSACNSQPWHFIIVDNDKLKNEVAEAAFSGIYSMNTFAKNAPVLIVVVTKKSRFAAKLGSFFRGVQYSLIDIGIACEHLILQAEEFGVGSCWLGWFNERKVKKILKIPRRLSVDIIISLGYQDEVNEQRNKLRESFEKICSYNKFDSKI